jgi:hypothetical protein
MTFIEIFSSKIANVGILSVVTLSKIRRSGNTDIRVEDAVNAAELHFEH